MSEVIKCRPKTKQVEALRTYKDQRLGDIHDFTIGCKNIYFNLSDNRFEAFSEPLDLDGCPSLNPGDYIVKDDKGYAAFFSPEEFEEKYEKEVAPSELHYVVTKYGFTVENAEFMLRDESIRAILIAPLIETSKAKRRGSVPTNITVNPTVSPTVNVESIAKSISASISNSLTNGSY